MNDFALTYLLCHLTTITIILLSKLVQFICIKFGSNYNCDVI